MCHLQVVSVLTSALEEALAAQLSSRKPQPSFGFSKGAAADQRQKLKAVSIAEVTPTAAAPAAAAMPQATAADTPPGTSSTGKDQPGPSGQQQTVNHTGGQQHLAPASQGCTCVIC